MVGSVGERTAITLNFDISEDTLEGESPWVPCSSATNSEFDDCLYRETTRTLLREFGCRLRFSYRLNHFGTSIKDVKNHVT